MKPAAIGVFAALLLVGAVSYTGFRGAIRAGEFTTLTPVFDGTCTDVAGLPGAEDMAQGRATYSSPLGSSGLKGSLSGSWLSYSIGKEFAALDLKGADQIAADEVGPVGERHRLERFEDGFAGHGHRGLP